MTEKTTGKAKKAEKSSAQQLRDAASGGPDPAKVTELAKSQLTMAEIAAELGCELAQIKALSELVRRGHLLGMAALKKIASRDALEHDGRSRHYWLETNAGWPNGARPRTLQMSKLRQAQIKRCKAETALSKSQEEPKEINIIIAEETPLKPKELEESREAATAVDGTAAGNKAGAGGGTPAGATAPGHSTGGGDQPGGDGVPRLADRRKCGL